MTQGDQNAEEQKIDNLKQLGYHHGPKGQLNAKIKELLEQIKEKSDSRASSAFAKSSRNINIESDSDNESKNLEDDKKDFEKEFMEYSKVLLEFDTPPKLVYLPTAKVMRKLILRNI